jgi:anti-sigma regulatory factor (Ser/Thr protein kinase)
MCAQTPIAKVTLDLDKKAPSRARKFVKEHGCMHAEEILDTAELLVSELVTNAVRHAAAPVMLVVDCRRRHLTVGVRDSSRKKPVLSHAGMWAESGRGVELVDRLSDKWGVRTERQGKTVWFELRC